MNEYNGFEVANMKNTCRACLRIANNVYSMTSIEINLYESFIEKVPNMHWNMCICLHCGWMLRKCQKFIEQCRKASAILNEAMDEDSKSFLYLNQMTLSHNFTTTQTNIYDMDSNIHNNDSADNDNDIFDNNDMLSDDDEVPLNVLKSLNGVTKDIKSKKRKKKNHKHTKSTNIEIKRNEIAIKEEADIDDQDEPPNDCKHKKNTALRKGFTSKMIQETNEYIVIKLTKDEVLQEMEMRSKSDAYTQSPYKCDKCVKGFNFEDVLLNHMEKHSLENGPLQCDMCEQYCRSAVSLRGHIKSHTTRYKCKLCGHTRLSRQHLLEHHAIAHTNAAPRYKCERCVFTTDKRTVIQRHVKSHAPAEQHACHKCGKLFKNINSLRVHTTRHDKSKRHQCTTCNKTFIYPSLLHKHVRAVHLNMDYYCVECDVRFKSPETMRLHFKKAKRHRTASSYKHACESCPCRFISASSLSAHAHVAHGAARRHVCSRGTCRRGYASRDALRAHVWRAHTTRAARATPNTCHVCGRQFSRKSVLKLHLRTHGGEGPEVGPHRAGKHEKQMDLPNESDTQTLLEA